MMRLSCDADYCGKKITPGSAEQKGWFEFTVARNTYKPGEKDVDANLFIASISVVRMRSDATPKPTAVHACPIEHHREVVLRNLHGDIDVKDNAIFTGAKDEEIPIDETTKEVHPK